MSHKQHWESVYRSKGDAELSWTQPEPETSLALIELVCPQGRVIDIGGGTSRLAERLLARGYSVAVLDVSAEALQRHRDRLPSPQIQWISADVTANPSLPSFDLWHDRAVFHFLTGASDRGRYIELLSRTLPVGGHAVIATFDLEGPPKCSGLEVQRYSSHTLARELGAGFELVKSVHEIHRTPWDEPQSFQYSAFRFCYHR